MNDVLENVIFRKPEDKENVMDLDDYDCIKEYFPQMRSEEILEISDIGHNISSVKAELVI